MQLESYLRKIRNFNPIFASDIYPRYESLFLRTTQHMTRVERQIGHHNFNLMNLDEVLQHGRDFPQIGKFEADGWTLLRKFSSPTHISMFSSARR